MLTTTWEKSRIKASEIEKYTSGGSCFIDEEKIQGLISSDAPSKEEVRDIIQKALSVQTLSLRETSALLNLNEPSLIEEMEDAAIKVKKKVYDNRIVTFAPLYLGNYCINDCVYCGFRRSNCGMERRALSLDEIQKETEVLAGKIGHKRVIAVYGEHPKNDIEYIVASLNTIYGTKTTTDNGHNAGIRRVNVNAAPMSIGHLEKLHGAGIGTYQVFQETYHRDTYGKVHPSSTVKGNYLWRLYSMHRAMDAGIDDVGIGVLFGLYNWKFEVMALAAHSMELEKRFGIGAHTISFPRVDPAINTPYSDSPPYRVSDSDFIKIILVLRLAVPHTGLIITARETAEMRRKALSLGITQTDASTRIGIGAYSTAKPGKKGEGQQFILGDTRSLDELIREFSQMGHITSFCTAGYRCGRTGKKIMNLLRSGQEGKFCKLNAVLTFREWIDDFASEETKKSAEPLLEKELAEIKTLMPGIYPQFMESYRKTTEGERDLFF